MRTSPSRKRPISDAALPASLWLAGGIQLKCSLSAAEGAGWQGMGRRQTPSPMATKSPYLKLPSVACSAVSKEPR